MVWAGDIVSRLLTLCALIIALVLIPELEALAALIASAGALILASRIAGMS